MCKEVAGVAIPNPTFPFNNVYPEPLGVNDTFWLVPPAANVSAPVPVMDPLDEPVPPLATGTVVIEIAGVVVALDIDKPEPTETLVTVPELIVVGAQAVPLYLKTCPEVALIEFSLEAVTAPSAI